MAAKKKPVHRTVSALKPASVKRGQPAPHIQGAIDALRKPKASKLGDFIDALYDARERRLEVQREVNALKKREEEAEQLVIQLLQAESLTKGSGTHASVSLKAKIVPRVDPAHWNEVFAQIAKKKAWDLLYKRINSEAYRERLAEPIDHVTTESVLDLSITALKKSA